MAFKTGSLSKLNAFPRAEDHLMQKTTTGAAVTVVGMLLMALLFIHEVRYQLTVRTVHQMYVDTHRGEKLPIAINITFPALPCKVLSLDAIDMSGKHEVDLDTNIWKIRINKEGYIIGSEFLSDLVEGEHKTEEEKQLAHVKHDDLGLHDEHGHSHAHTSMGDPEKVIKEIKTALEQREGCRVFGVLDVERVAGNFHVSMHGLSIFVAQQIYESVTDVNVSHIIHDLSFGPKYPGIHNPLDGTERILHEESGTFKYFIKVFMSILAFKTFLVKIKETEKAQRGESRKGLERSHNSIVPTEYRFLNEMVMPSNQFSVSEYFMSSKLYDRNWPAVFFVYDISPISVKIREERRHFGHFLTRICAVIGGTFAVTGMLDRWIYGLVEAVLSAQKAKGIMR